LLTPADETSVGSGLVIKGFLGGVDEEMTEEKEVAKGCSADAEDCCESACRCASFTEAGDSTGEHKGTLTSATVPDCGDRERFGELADSDADRGTPNRKDFIRSRSLTSADVVFWISHSCLMI